MWELVCAWIWAGVIFGLFDDFCGDLIFDDFGHFFFKKIDI
jgi:hypothetical protein